MLLSLTFLFLSLWHCAGGAWGASASEHRFRIQLCSTAGRIEVKLHLLGHVADDTTVVVEAPDVLRQLSALGSISLFFHMKMETRILKPVLGCSGVWLVTPFLLRHMHSSREMPGSTVDTISVTVPEVFLDSFHTVSLAFLLGIAIQRSVHS